jgi:hypothetical protein
MQCKEFEAVLEQEGLAPLPLAARSHLAECSACQNLLADLNVLVFSANELPAEIDPPERLWIALRARMEAEGLIKQPLAPAEKTPWWQGLSTLLRPRVLVPAGAALVLAFAAFVAVHKGPVEVAKTVTPVAAIAQVPTPQQPKEVAPSSSASIVTAPGSEVVASVKVHPKPVAPPTTPLKPSPSDSLYLSTPVALQDAEQNLNGPSLRGSVEADASLRENLRVINEVIAECQKHLKKYPNDTMAREYLASAYHQKAELLAAMLDSGRSEQ